MAEKQRIKSPCAAAADQPSRLQRRRPASLQIGPAPANYWNAAIPLLSPLSTSPTAVDLKAAREEMTAAAAPQLQQQRQVAEAEKPVVFKKWQHPAAPFYYETASFAKPSFFVPV